MSDEHRPYASCGAADRPVATFFGEEAVCSDSLFYASIADYLRRLRVLMIAR